MKDLIKKTQKELNVNKLSICCLIIFSIFSCSVKKGDFYKKEVYEIIRKKSKNGFSQLKFYTFSFYNKNETIPASIEINGVVTHSKFSDSIANINISVLNDKYDINIFFIGKETIRIKNLLVKSGDSIVINSYMKEDLTPLY